MKILVSYRGIPESHGWATGDMLSRALVALGHDVVPYGNYYRTRDQLGREPNERKLERTYDLIIFMECNDEEPQYLELKEYAARTKTKIVGWFFDNTYYSDHLSHLIELFRFERIFLANPLELRRFKGSLYLPYACDQELHGRTLDQTAATDLALFGSVRPDRLLLIEKLRKAGLDAQLLGGIFREEYIQRMSQTRMTVNQNPRKGAGLLNMRTFEAPAAGSLLLLEERDFRANRSVFLEEEACVPYSSVGNLAKKARILLNDPSRLLDLRRRGQSFFLERHTYLHRARELLRSL
jgi:spore maturation protein CgeB